MIEHCISSFENKCELKMYRIYMSDSVRTLVNAFYRRCGATEDVIPQRFIDMITLKEEIKETEGDIIQKIRKKLEG